MFYKNRRTSAKVQMFKRTLWNLINSELTVNLKKHMTRWTRRMLREDKLLFLTYSIMYRMNIWQDKCPVLNLGY